MSQKNGDKSRFQINRKRVVLRRAKAQETAAAAAPAGPKRFAKAKTTPPRTAQR
jgi:hypothetical protein